MDNTLIDLMHECVVKLSIREMGRSGTGFFVGPENIITCAHVVENNTLDSKDYYEEEIIVNWQGDESTF